MDTDLGDKVGYAIRFEDVTGPNTIIKVIPFIFLFLYDKLWSKATSTDLKNPMLQISTTQHLLT